MDVREIWSEEKGGGEEGVRREMLYVNSPFQHRSGSVVYEKLMNL